MGVVVRLLVCWYMRDGTVPFCSYRKVCVMFAWFRRVMDGVILGVVPRVRARSALLDGPTVDRWVDDALVRQGKRLYMKNRANTWPYTDPRYQAHAKECPHCPSLPPVDAPGDGVGRPSQVDDLDDVEWAILASVDPTQTGVVYTGTIDEDGTVHPDAHDAEMAAHLEPVVTARVQPRHIWDFTYEEWPYMWCATCCAYTFHGDVSPEFRRCRYCHPDPE